jgi:fructokinase
MAMPPSADPSAQSGSVRVLCFGEALLDRLGAPGRDPAAPGAEDRLGGAPANVACALARLGTPVAFLGRLGDDGIGRAFQELFRQRGVEVSGLQWDRERPSRTVLVRRDGAGERSFAGFAADQGAGFADQAVAVDPLLRAAAPLLPGARWLVVGTLALASPTTALAQEGLRQQAAAAGLGLAVDVNWRPTFWGLAPDCEPPPAALAAIGKLLQGAALIKCSREEAEWLFGAGADPATIAGSLPCQPAVLITDGPRPLRWWLGGQGGAQAVPVVPVVDSTGAGDAFLAGLLHRLCGRAEFHSGAGVAPTASWQAEVVRFAAACGALTCTAAGAIDAQPTTVAVERLLESAAHQP